MVVGEHIGRADGEVGGVADRNPVLDGCPDDRHDEWNERRGEAQPLQRTDLVRRCLVHRYDGPPSAPLRCRSASKHSTVVAIATLRLSARPRCSMRTHWLDRRLGSTPCRLVAPDDGDSPAPVGSDVRYPVVRRRADQAQTGCGNLAERRRHDRDVEECPGRRPHDLRVRLVDGPRGDATASAPAASAERMIVPRLPGSPTRSATTTNDAEARARVGRGPDHDGEQAREASRGRTHARRRPGLGRTALTACRPAARPGRRIAIRRATAATASAMSVAPSTTNAPPPTRTTAPDQAP